MRRPGRGKYRAVKTRVLDKTFDSKFEASVALDLHKHLAAGESLHFQHSVKLACGAKSILDFIVVDDSTGEILRYVEAKGFQTPVWRLKLRMLTHERPDVVERLTVVHQAPRAKRKAA